MGHNSRREKRGSCRPEKEGQLKRKDREAAEIAELETRIKEITPNKGEQNAEECKFADLPLSTYTQKALLKKDFTVPTKIQRAAIPHALAGRDILGAAKTGSGKTLAFLIPTLERLYRSRWSHTDGLGALIISPTRELAMQIFEVLRTVGSNHSFSAGLVVGGSKFEEEKKHIWRMNIIVATPGRLVQHLEQTAEFDTSALEVLVLDEADRILDMGFSDQVSTIVSYLPGSDQRQTMLFSATQTKSVKDLARLSLRNPEYIGVHEKADHATPENLVQTYIVTELDAKLEALFSFIKSHLKSKIIVFFSSCRQVAFVHAAFCKLQPGVPLMCLHGRIKQKRRTLLYYDFLRKPAAVMFATDIAARGLDFPNIDWVVQADAPEDTAAYIHRVGRTARYNRGGKSLLMLLPSEEPKMVENLEQAQIPLKKIKTNPNKTISIQGKIASLVAADKDLKELAQKAFSSYVRSICLMPDKEVFDASTLPLDGFAKALGLPSTPKLKFLVKEVSREHHRQLKNKNKKLQALKEKIAAAKAEKKRLAEEGTRMNESTPSKEGQKLASEVRETAESEADDFMVVKRRHEWGEEEDDVTLPEKNKKKRLKIRNTTASSRVVFDDEGKAVAPLALLAADEATEETSKDTTDLREKADEFAQQMQKRLQEREEIDKSRERERVQEKHRKKRLREKAEKPDLGVGGAVLMPPELSGEESDFDDRDGEDQDYTSDGALSDSDVESEEEMVDASAKKVDGKALQSREELALQLLRRRG